MRRSLLVLASLAAWPAAAASAAPPETIPGQVVVRFSSGAGAGAQAHALGSVETDAVRVLALPRARVMQLAPGQSVNAAIAELEAQPGVAWAEPNYVVRADAIPTDPLYPSLWGLEQTSDIDIDASAAWDTATAAVTVGVADTGVDPTHPDLGANLLPGRDFVTLLDDHATSDTDARDLNGHGTHVAGTIAMEHDGVGGVGVAPNAKILPLRALGVNGGSSADVAAAFAYAGAQGVRVVNASLGSSGASAAIQSAIQGAPNTLFVVAAGNDGVNVETTPHYPCAFPEANILCVGAIARAGGLAPYSNRGATSVDIAAPGGTGSTGGAADQIVSSFPTFADAFVADVSSQLAIDGQWTEGPPLNPWGLRTFSSGTPTLSYPSSGTIGAAVNDPIRVTNPINLPAGTRCKLEASVWYDRDGSAGDHISFEAHSGGGIFTPLLDLDDDTNGFFESEAVDISQFAGTAMTFRIRAVTDASGSGAFGVGIRSLSIECLAAHATADGAHGGIAGTSMASPHVAGVAALLLGRSPGLTTAQLRDLILNSTDVDPALGGEIAGNRRLNAQKAMGLFLAPTAGAAAPSPTGFTTATLRGSVDTQGGPGTVRFELGPTTAYGRTTPDVQLAAAPGAREVTANVTGLQPGRLYHARVVVTTGGGTAQSTDITFSTRADTKKPTTKFTLPSCKGKTAKKCAAHRRTSAAWRQIKGTAADPQPGMGVDRVEIAVIRKLVTGKCERLTKTGWKSSGCQAKPVWLKANGKKTWSKSLPNRKVAGYRVAARSVDLARNVGPVKQMTFVIAS